MKKLTEQFDLHDFEPQILLCEYRNDANLVGAAANYLAVRQGRIKSFREGAACIKEVNEMNRRFLPKECFICCSMIKYLRGENDVKKIKMLKCV